MANPGLGDPFPNPVDNCAEANPPVEALYLFSRGNVFRHCEVIS